MNGSIEASVKRNAAQAGLRLMREETFLRYQYLLVFGREPSWCRLTARAANDAPRRRQDHRRGDELDDIEHEELRDTRRERRRERPGEGDRNHATPPT